MPPKSSGAPVPYDALRQLGSYLVSQAPTESSAEVREWILVWLDAWCEDNPRDLTRDERIEAEGIRQLLSDALLKARQKRN